MNRTALVRSGICAVRVLAHRDDRLSSSTGNTAKSHSPPPAKEEMAVNYGAIEPGASVPRPRARRSRSALVAAGAIMAVALVTLLALAADRPEAPGRSVLFLGKIFNHVHNAAQKAADALKALFQKEQAEKAAQQQAAAAAEAARQAAEAEARRQAHEAELEQQRKEREAEQLAKQQAAAAAAAQRLAEEEARKAQIAAAAAAAAAEKSEALYRLNS